MDNTSMRVWLYGRISRDEDPKSYSMANQMNILNSFRDANHHIEIGRSFDNNVTGMHFMREGIEELSEAVINGRIDAVLIKDFSRLGRHKTQTALFIEFLHTYKVRVVSVTENLDSCNEEHEILIGIKQVLNDYYARDASRRIRSGYHQKQKEGIIVTPPFGYIKDSFTGQVKIDEDCTEIVCLVFQLYLDGYGYRRIAQILTERGYKPPAFHKFKQCGQRFGGKKTKAGQLHIWNERSVQRILTNEVYIGTLICHKTTRKRLHEKATPVPLEQQFRHEGFLPAIIPLSVWQTAQKIHDERINSAGSGLSTNTKQRSRYSGLLHCADCGATFTVKRRNISPDIQYVEYVCNNYHRIGVNVCSAHRIREGDLDKLILDQLYKLRSTIKESWQAISNRIESYKATISPDIAPLEGLRAQRDKLINENDNLVQILARHPSQSDTIVEAMDANQACIDKLENEILFCAESISQQEVKLQCATFDMDFFFNHIENNAIPYRALARLINKIDISEIPESGLQVNISLFIP